jgi:hypothetical protein
MTKAAAAAVAGSAANPMTRYLIPIAIGAVLGSLMGYFGQCTSGACPLTSTWWRGAIYGGFIGLMFSVSSRP